MYFDTLKLSSVEQSTSSTSAKGGYKNPELITWNFGKTITVNLTDALYTPASLSLLWGGKFGISQTEINGFWNPLYKENNQITNTYTYTSKYLGYDKEKLKYPYILNINEEPIEYGCNLFLPRVQKIGQPAERAKLVLKNFGDFKINVRKEGVQYNSRYLLHEVGYAGKIYFDNQERDTFYDYEWKDCELQMLSLEGRQDVYYIKHIDVLLRVNSVDYSKKILIKNSGENDYYNSQIDIYNDNIKVGTFYINDTVNNLVEPENSLNPIQSGINEIILIDRLEKCCASNDFCIDTTKNFESNAKKDLPQYKQIPLTVFIDPRTMKPYQSNCSLYIRKNGEVIYGNLCTIKRNDTYYKWTRSAAGKNESLGNEIVVTGYDFPGTYKLVANTYTRARLDGSDSRLQIEIPLCTVVPESVIELTAEGEPAIFSMQLKVMENVLGEMIKIQKFNVGSEVYDNYESGSTKVKRLTSIDRPYECEVCTTPTVSFIKDTKLDDMQILLPQQNDYYCFPIDCMPPFNTKNGESYLMIPKTNRHAKKIYKALKDGTLDDSARDQLLIKMPLANTFISINNEPYLIAVNGNYEYYEDNEDANTVVIDGKICVFITQQNMDKFSPIEFTITGVVDE